MKFLPTGFSTLCQPNHELDHSTENLTIPLMPHRPIGCAKTKIALKQNWDKSICKGAPQLPWSIRRLNLKLLLSQNT